MVDIFHQRGESSGQWLVETGTKQAVDNKRARREVRQVEIDGHLCEVPHAVGLDQPLLVNFAIVRKFVVYIEKINVYRIIGLGQHSRHSQSIAPIVAGTRKHCHRRMVIPPLHDDMGHHFGGTLHKVDALHGLVLNGEAVQFADLRTCKYLHIAKIQNKRQINKIAGYFFTKKLIFRKSLKKSVAKVYSILF